MLWSSIFEVPVAFWMGVAGAAATALAYAAFILIYPICVPPIHEYPYQLPEDYAQRQRDKRTTVVIAGSYNPPHRGHAVMMAHLAERYGRVVVVLGMNPNKHYAVTPQQRSVLLRKMLSSYPNVQVEVVSGYIWRFAKQPHINARLFFRGIRTWQKDGREERQLQILNTWGPLLLGPLWWPIPTHYLQGAPEFSHVSSTLIREICSSSSSSASTSTSATTNTLQSRGGGANSSANDENDGNTQLQKVRNLVPDCIAEDVISLYGYSVVVHIYT